MDAGALAVIIGGMSTHSLLAGMQEYGCKALGKICSGNDAAGPWIFTPRSFRLFVGRQLLWWVKDPRKDEGG